LKISERSGEIPKMEARQRINKNTYVSPVGDRNKDDAYGLKDKALNSDK